MTNIKTTIRVDIKGSGSHSIQHSQDVEAWTVIDVTVPAGSTTTPAELEVEVQPSGSGQVQFVMITAETFTEDLTYSVTGGSADVALDGPQLMIGAGAVGLLGANQNTITFSNSTESEIDVHIRVGRDATP